MNLAKPYRVLMKHLDKPECFLEDRLFREWADNIQNADLILAKPMPVNQEAVKDLHLSIVENNNLTPIKPPPSLRYGR